jgi:hypothetical protein
MSNDAFEVYFAEKLWEWIPGHHRDLDGRKSPPGTLRAIVEIWAREAARLRREQDRLWDNAFIETCEDWAVPYIGQLVADRPVSALNRRGARISVAKAVHYRRRSGTRPVLEELITDIAGHEGIVTEGFRRLARAWHRLDGPLGGPGAPATPAPGGMADLRSPRLLDLAQGPFDGFAYMPDIRRPAAAPVPGRAQRTEAPLARLEGPLGIAGIRKLGFHLYRLQAWSLRAVTPSAAQGGAARFRFDPSGRDIPLFQRSTRASGGSQGLTGTGFPDWREATAWEVPAPMRCRVLGHAAYTMSEAAVLHLGTTPGIGPARMDQLRRLAGLRLESDGALFRALSQLPDGAFFTQTAPLRHIREATLQPDCGAFALVPASVAIRNLAPDPIPPHLVTAGGLAAWTVSAQGRRAVIDPERGRFRVLGTAPANLPGVDYTIGAPGPIGAGPWPRPEAVARDPTGHMSGGGAIAAAALPAQGIVQIDDSATYQVQPNQTTLRDLVVQAAEGERPYLTRSAPWTLQSGIANAALTLDGLWIGATAGNVQLRLRGSFARVRLAFVTLDPGGAATADPGSPILQPIRLDVRGEVDRLEIHHCVVGRITTSGTGQVNRLVVRDSIVQAPLAGGSAIDLPSGEVILERVTVLGDADVHRLYATETLAAGIMTVRDTQAGCFRFGAYGQGSRLPHPYQSHELPDGFPIFTTTRFGEAAYGQLSPGAPAFLHTGAELGAEIGAYCGLNGAVRLEGLRQKTAEFMPLGLLPFFIAET